jgi:hypothetical protein
MTRSVKVNRFCVCVLAALLCGCSQGVKEGAGMSADRGVTVPALGGGGDVRVDLTKPHDPFVWAYILDTSRGEDRRKAEQAFDLATRKDPKLLGKVAHVYGIHGMIKRAEAARPRLRYRR